MIHAIRIHWPALTLAVLVGLFLVMPPLSAKLRFGIDFNDPRNSIRVLDEPFYFTRMQEVIDSYPMLGSSYLWEHKAKPPTQIVFLGEYLISKPLQFLGVGVVAAGVFYDFLFPALNVIFAYACLFAVTRARWLSVLASSALFLGLFTNDFVRAVSPQFNFLFWLSEFFLLYFLFMKFEDPRKRRILAVLAAINFGLLFYLYTYYWTFYLAFFGIAFAFSLARGFFDYAKTIAVIAGGGVIVAIPYFLTVLNALALPEYQETIRRIGMIDSHFPSGIAIVTPAAILLGAAAFLYRANFWNRSTLFFTAGTLSAIAVVNQHVITGKNLEFSSHYYLLSVFWFVFFAAHVVERIHARQYRWRGITVVIAAVFVFAFVSLNLYEKIVVERGVFFGNRPVNAKMAAELQRYSSIFDWLKKNTKKDDVVYAPVDISGIIPIYTSNNVYFSNLARLSFLSNAELLDRFVLNNYYEKADADFVADNIHMIYGVYFINRAGHINQENKVRSLFGFAPKHVDLLPDEVVDGVVRRFSELRERGFASGVKRYRIDYLVWDRERQPDAGFKEMSSLAKEYEQNGIVLYRVK